jgi:ParB/RepB/Spo0J family partition protein
MLERGCIVPVRVQALGDGTYRLVDGEKRYKAAAMASLMELPASVRAVDPGDVDVAELEGELLVDAVVANQLRSQLTPVEEALACRRLKTEYGLTLKGIAQRLQMTQARVCDRLQILALPEALWPRVSGGEIPVGAIAALVALEKIAPGLAEAAVTLVLDRGDVYDAEPFTWRDVADDALSVVAGGLHDETIPAPAGVFVSSHRYPLSTFALDDKTRVAAAKLAELLGKPVDALELHFDRATVQQARALKAAHTPAHGWVTLIVGQDIADTLAADQVTAALKAARTEAKRRRDADAAAAPRAAANANAAGPAGAAVDEDTVRELARQERAAAAAAREQAAVFNDGLGVAITNSLSRVNVDERTVKILTAINVAAELDRIAMRGARYGFPGWVTQDTKRGTKRVYIDQRAAAKAKAVEYLAGAKTAGELAGRTIALLAMAIYADENAVASSNRAFHQVTIEHSMPWADDVMQLIDELAGEKLPAALLEAVLAPRRERHAERRAALAAQARARERVAQLEPRVDELDAAQLAELKQAGRVAHGEYTIPAYALRDKIRTRRTTLTAAAAAEPGDSDSERQTPAAEPIDRDGVSEEPAVDAAVDEVLERTGDAE